MLITEVRKHDGYYSSGTGFPVSDHSQGSIVKIETDYTGLCD